MKTLDPEYCTHTRMRLHCLVVALSLTVASVLSCQRHGVLRRLRQRPGQRQLQPGAGLQLPPGTSEWSSRAPAVAERPGPALLPVSSGGPMSVCACRSGCGPWATSCGRSSTLPRSWEEGPTAPPSPWSRTSCLDITPTWRGRAATPRPLPDPFTQDTVLTGPAARPTPPSGQMEKFISCVTALCSLPGLHGRVSQS